MRLSDGTEERSEERVTSKKRETLNMCLHHSFLSEQMLAQEQKSKSLSIHLTLNINNILYHFDTLVVIEKYRIRKKREKRKK